MAGDARSELIALADSYERQANFYEARAYEASHTAIAAKFFRREAVRLRALARSEQSR